jgi:preprotein translocase subunit SecA
MTRLANQELFSIFDARRVKAPELRGLDAMVNNIVGFVTNRRSMLAKLREQEGRIERLEPEIKALTDARFKEAVAEVRDLARLNRLTGDPLDRAMAIIREGAVRAVGMRPYPVQIMGALAMCQGAIAEMATGEGKTLTASLAATLWGWHGRPVHVITVNDYLVARDAEEMGPVYRMCGLKVGFVTHETGQGERQDHYRRDVIYCTSKELVADFLRDQIALGNLRNSTQTQLQLLMSGRGAGGLQVPGLFRVLVDEADSLLIDEAVTPLIISNSPQEEPNADLYIAANDLAAQLELGKDFTIDRTVRQVDLTLRGQERLEHLSDDKGFWRGQRRREELVQQALSARHCFVRDEQYLISPDGKVQIIDEFTGRVMADRSWRHGLHQAIEVKEGVKVTADKENLARLSFQRFFRQYPIMGGMTGTAWEAAGELWSIFQRRVIKIPTNKPNIRVQLPTRMFDTMDQKYDAVVARVAELNEKGVPVLVGTRSVLASEEVSRRLAKLGLVHRVLNAAQNEQEANIVAEAGQPKRITVATNMAGRGTDIKLGRGVAELGGLHVISAEPHASYRVDRQLFGRAARQGDPGCAQQFISVEDDLFIRHARQLRHNWRTIGPDRLMKIAQSRAERIARFNRKQVLKNDDWMDQSLPF